MAKRETSEETVEEHRDDDRDQDDRAGSFGGKAPSKEKKEQKPLPGAGTRDGEKLREAVRAFEVGDYRRVRARCDELANAEDPDVREAAADLKSRTTVDPVQVVVVLACAAVLATIVYVWVF